MTPRRRMVEQAPTWRKGKRPEDMRAVVARWVAEADDPTSRDPRRGPPMSSDALMRTVLSWIAVAGDVHSAALARLVLGLDEHGDPLDEDRR